MCVGMDLAGFFWQKAFTTAAVCPAATDSHPLWRGYAPPVVCVCEYYSSPLPSAQFLVKHI